LSKFSHRTQAELAILLVAVIWGVTFVVVKEALADIGPFLFLAIRFILAFIVLALLSFHNIRQIRRSTVLAGCLLGFFLFIGYIFQTVGLQYTTSSNAGFITGLSVVLVPVFHSIMLRKWPVLITVVTVILAASGLFLMSVPAGSFSLSYGDLLVLICAFGFALHIVFVDKYSYRHNAVAITGVQILFVGLVSLVMGLFIEPIPASISANTVVAIFITAVFATALAFLIQNALQKYSTPSRFAVVLTTEPVFAALAGFLWAGEVFTIRTLIGAGLILFSMLVSITTRKAPKTTVTTHS
jgi:drug/metabolite transporter (DMT)-like permease